MLIKNLEKTAIAGKDYSISYSQLLGQIYRYSLLFGEQPSQKVLIFSENRPEWVFTLYAAWKNNAAVIPVDYMSSADELNYILNDSKPEIIFYSKSRHSVLKDSLSLPGCDPHLICFETIGHNEKEVWDAPAGLNYPDKDTTALIIYTSGTTGLPKGVVLTFENLLVNIKAVSEEVPIITRKECVLMLLPLHHIFPLMGTLVIPLYAGSTIAVSPSMSSEDILTTLRKHEVSILIGVPRLYNTIRKGIMDKVRSSRAARILFSFAEAVNSKMVSKFLFKAAHKKFGGNIKFLVSGGAAIDKQVVKDFRTLGFELLEGYGMSEAAPMISFTRPFAVKLGSVGNPLTSIEVEIREGEVVARGKNITPGYYNKPSETEEVLRNGWLYTGDLGYFDDEGYLYITGRKKEIIILSNGKNINPDEIEYKLATISGAVKEAGIHVLNDTLHAIIYPDFAFIKNERAENIRDFIKWNVIDVYNTQSSPYKKILGFSLVNEELPKTRLGKIQHFKLEQFTIDVKNRETEKQFIEFREYTLLKKFLEEQFEKRVNPYDHIEIDLAVDSLGLVSLSVFIQASFGIDINEGDFSKYESILELAEYIRDNRSKMVEENINWSDILRIPFHFHPPVNNKLGTILRHLSCLFIRTYFRVKVEGSIDLPDEPCIIAPNHQSFFDGFFLSAVLKNKIMKRTFFYAKEKHFRKGWLKSLAHRNNIIIMDINTDLKQSIQKLAELLKKGRNVVIFPEGTRSQDGTLGKFKKTFAILSHELGIPVVPVVINGSYKALHSGSWLPRPFTRIRIKILQPVYPVHQNYDSLREIVYKKIAGGLY